MFRSLRDSIENLVDNLRDFAAEIIGGGRVVDTDAPEPRAPEPVEQEAPIHEIDIEDEDWDDDDEPEDINFLDYIEALRAADSDEPYSGADYRTFEDADIDKKHLRVVRYTSAQDAASFLEDAGLSAFSEILYIEDEDSFTIAVYDSPGSTEA